MIYKLILELPERVYEEVKAAAEESNQTPSEWIITSLSRLIQNGEHESSASEEPPLSPLYTIHEHAISTGVADLAEEHDHYLYGTPKHDG